MDEDLCYTPRAALQRVLKSDRAGNAGHNHVGRDVATLRRAGVEPEKLGGRWIVRAGALARWAAGEALPQKHPEQAKRGPGRPRKSGGRLDVQMNNGNGGAP